MRCCRGSGSDQRQRSGRTRCAEVRCQTRPRELIVAEIVSGVRESIGAVASFKSAAVVAQLPKTRSGKSTAERDRRIAMADPDVPRRSKIPRLWSTFAKRCNRLDTPRRNNLMLPEREQRLWMYATISEEPGL